MRDHGWAPHSSVMGWAAVEKALDDIAVQECDGAQLLCSTCFKKQTPEPTHGAKRAGEDGQPDTCLNLAGFCSPLCMADQPAVKQA
jgi:hypothetical protein